MLANQTQNVQVQHARQIDGVKPARRQPLQLNNSLGLAVKLLFYINFGMVHRLAKLGKLSLESIEALSSSYLGENNIVGFEDTYGRS